MPVSLTSKRKVWVVGVASNTETLATISPCWVNLTALPSKLLKTWRKRTGSPRATMGSLGKAQSNSTSLRWALSANRVATSSTRARNSKSTISSSSLPASILEKSKTSLMILSRLTPDCWMTSAKRRCLAGNSVPNRRSAIPRMPFIGVRISWLMLARNCDFARLAASARSLAALSSRTSACSSLLAADKSRVRAATSVSRRAL